MTVRITPNINHPLPRGTYIECQVAVCTTCAFKKWEIVRGSIIGIHKKGDHFEYRINTKIPAVIPDYNVVKIVREVIDG
jgi:hypothetical protein